MDITFNCGSCGQSLVVDAAGAGQLVDCPKCGRPLEVPYKSESLNGVARANLRTATAGPPGRSIPTGDTKKCPFCAETIKREARVCRFCGYNLETGQPGQASHPKSVSPPVVRAQSSVTDGVKIGVGLFIVLLVGLIGIAVLTVLNNPEFWRGFKEGMGPELIGMSVLMSFLWDNLLVVVCIPLCVLAVISFIWAEYARVHQKRADSFIGITEQELIRRLGQPREIRTGSRGDDGPYRMLVYDDRKGYDTRFMVFERNGLVWSGCYRGRLFSH